MRLRSLILAAIFTIVFLLICPFLLYKYAYSLEQNRAIILSYLVTNPTNEPIKNAHFYTYLPVKECGWQKVTRWEYPCRDAALIDDDLGNTILDCRLPLIPPYSTLPIDIRAWITLQEGPGKKNWLDPKDTRFIQPSHYVESNATEIKALAQRLKTQSAYRTSKRIYNWVKNNIHFKDYISKPLGALNALKLKTGDCTEGMALFVALARADGISSVGMAGYKITRNGKVAPLAYHNWAMFYAKERWRIADPKGATFDSQYNQYVATIIIGKRSAGRFPLGLYERFKVSNKALRVIQL